MSNTNSVTKLSIVSPLYNEEGNVNALVDRIIASVRPLDVSYEIILVDDGSKDNTWESISDACASDPNTIGVRLSRNFGHQHALLAGLSAARGQAIISLDGDLQHPPERIPDLLELWNKGYDIVQTKRQDQHIASPFKRITSNLFYRFFSLMTNVYLDPGSSDFRLLDRKVLDTILSFKDTDLFFRGAVQWVGFKTTTLPFDAEPRFSGTTKYSLSKMLKFASGAIVSFSVIPLKISVYVGLLTTLLAFLEIVYITLMYFRGDTVPGWASTVGVLSLLFGILFINIGIMGTYMARFHMALQNRPSFIVSEILLGKNGVEVSGERND